MERKYLLAIGCMLLATSCSDQKKDVAKAPIRVETEIVSKGLGGSGQSYVGIIEEREATAVSFTGMGVVKRVLVNEGQYVSKGQLLAEMDDTQARSMLAAAEAQMAQADDALKRYGMLHDNGSLPEVKWVEIQSKVAQAKSQLEVTKKNLADCRLIAPVSGVIGQKQVKAGETALPSQAVVTILDVSSVKVKVAIPEAEIGSLTKNTPTTIRVDALGKTLTGGMIEKGVVADALTHTYDIRINVANGDRKLLPGMVATVYLTPQALQEGGGSINSFKIPVTSVQRKADGGLFVWTVAKDSTAHRTSVEVGEMMGNRVVVSNGIADGQRIITEGYQKLSEGTKVVY